MATVSLNYTPSGDQSSKIKLDIREPMRLAVLAYAINPARLDDFQKFYKDKIHAWMEERKVRHAHAFLVENTLVVLTTSEGNVPWITTATAICGLAEYLATKQPLDIQKLPTFSHK
jgi:hypothetical protein